MTNLMFSSSQYSLYRSTEYDKRDIETKSRDMNVLSTNAFPNTSCLAQTMKGGEQKWLYFNERMWTLHKAWLPRPYPCRTKYFRLILFNELSYDRGVVRCSDIVIRRSLQNASLQRTVSLPYRIFLFDIVSKTTCRTVLLHNHWDIRGHINAKTVTNTRLRYPLTRSYACHIQYCLILFSKRTLVLHYCMILVKFRLSLHNAPGYRAHMPAEQNNFVWYGIQNEL